MPQITISQENFTRLQAAAIPLVDTVDTVIARALDELEKGTTGPSNSTERTFSAGSPPDLSFTTVRWASVDGAVLAGAETYWNLILMAVIRAAAAHGAVFNQISKRLLANHIGGMKEDGGYKFVPEARVVGSRPGRQQRLENPQPIWQRTSASQLRLPSSGKTTQRPPCPDRRDGFRSTRTMRDSDVAQRTEPAVTRCWTVRKRLISPRR